MGSFKNPLEQAPVLVPVSENDIRLKPAANDEKILSEEGLPNDYFATAGIYRELKELVGDTMIDSESNLPSEWDAPLMELAEKFLKIPMNSGARNNAPGKPYSFVLSEFDSSIRENGLEERIAYYSDLAEQTAAKIQKEKDREKFEESASQPYDKRFDKGEATGEVIVRFPH